MIIFSRIIMSASSFLISVPSDKEQRPPSITMNISQPVSGPVPQTPARVDFSHHKCSANTISQVHLVANPSTSTISQQSTPSTSTISQQSVPPSVQPTTLKAQNEKLQNKSNSIIFRSLQRLRLLTRRLSRFSPAMFLMQQPAASNIQIPVTLPAQDSQQVLLLPNCPHPAMDPHLCGSERHFQEFRHRGHPTRQPCPSMLQCEYQNDVNHLKEFYHAPQRPIGIPASENHPVFDFRLNHEMISASIRKYLEGQSPTPFEIPTIFRQFVQSLLPCHRLTVDRLRSIIMIGTVMSRSEMKLEKTPAQIASGLLDIPSLRVFRDEFFPSADATKQADEFIVAYGEFVAMLESPHFQGRPEDCMSMQQIALDLRRGLLCFSTEKNIHTIETLIVDVIHAIRFASDSPMETGVFTDTVLGTHQSVFSILGPNAGSCYGNICLVFRREILHHPDSNVTMCAGTSFFTGQVKQYKPYLADSIFHTSPGRIRNFHDSKMSATVDGFEEAMALELIAQMHNTTPMSYEKATLSSILGWWLNKNSHGVFEAHLPSRIPLGMVAQVIIPANVYDTELTNTERTILCRLVGARNVIRLEQVPAGVPNSENHNDRQLLNTITQLSVNTKLLNPDPHLSSPPTEFRLPAVKGLTTRVKTTFGVHADKPTHVHFRLHSREIHCGIRFLLFTPSNTTVAVILGITRESIVLHSHQPQSGNVSPELSLSGSLISHLRLSDAIRNHEEISLVVSIYQRCLMVEFAGKTRSCDKTTTSLRFNFETREQFNHFGLSFKNILGRQPIDVQRLIISTAPKAILSPTHPLLPYQVDNTVFVTPPVLVRKNRSSTDSVSKRRRVDDSLSLVAHAN